MSNVIAVILLLRATAREIHGEKKTNSQEQTNEKKKNKKKQNKTKNKKKSHPLCIPTEGIECAVRLEWVFLPELPLVVVLVALQLGLVELERIAH
jgi:hypothetical protein